MLRRFLIGSMLGFLALPAFSQFGPPQVFPGSAPETPIYHGDDQGDLDADGFDDLLLSNDHTIYYLRNGGANTFSDRVDIATLTSIIRSLFIGDLDNDGDNDILAVTYGDGLSSIIKFTNNGSGVFDSGSLVVSLTGVLTIAYASAADIDMDGDMDILFINDGAGLNTSLGLMLNNGGTYGSFITLGTLGTDFLQCYSVQDVDGDGDMDIIAGSTNKLFWWKNNGSYPFATQPAITQTDHSYFPMVCKDLNMDGRVDIVTATENSGTQVYLNVDGGTTWSLEAVGGPGQVSTFTLQDLDGDGDQDLVLGYEDQVRWYENDGSGGFGQEHTVFSSHFNSYPTDNLTVLSTLDYNGDGAPDIIARGANWDVFLNLGGGAFAEPSSIIPGWTSPPSDIVPLDVDGDGIEDVLGTFVAENKIGWYRNDGTGHWDTLRTITRSAFGPGNIVLADLNGDGVQDVLTSCQNDLVWYPHESGGGLGTQVLISSDTVPPYLIKAVDMDGDGDLDVVRAGQSYSQAITWFENDGTGAFGPAQLIAINTPPDPILDVVDINSDQAAEVVFLNNGPPSYTPIYLPNNGDGTFGPQTSLLPNIPFQVALEDAADVNGDGNVDMLFTLGYVPPFTLNWCENDGTGHFGAMQTLFTLPSDWSSQSQLVLKDLDNDGDKDMLLNVLSATNSSSSLDVSTNESGVFTVPVLATVPLPPPTPVVYSISAAHLSGGPANDILARTLSGPEWFKNYFGTIYQVHGSTFCDENGDGVKNPGEQGISWCQVASTPTTVGALSDSLGNYNLLAEVGSFSVSSEATLPDTLWSETTSSSYDVTLTQDNPVTSDINFGYEPLLDTSIIAPLLTIEDGLCGSEVPIWLSIANLGTRIEHGLLALNLDTLYTYVGATDMPDSIVDNTIWWSFDHLGYYATRSIQVTVQLPEVEAIGSVTQSVLEVTTLDNAGSPTGVFTNASEHAVDCSFDPNGKEVFPRGYGPAGAVDIGTQAVTYTIHFQNTGTTAAQDVVLRDTLAPELDRAVLQLIGFSHQPTAVTLDQNGVMTVRLDSIFLPDSASDPIASQGFVAFRIGLQPGLPDLTAIRNAADIYFDLNSPVITDTTLTTLVDCALWQPEITEPEPSILHVTTGDTYQWFLNGVALAADTTDTLVVVANGSYMAEVTSSFGCTAVSGPYDFTSAGINSISTPLLSIAPNPFTAQTKLHFNEVLTSAHEIEVVDVCGRVLQSLQGNGTRELRLSRKGLSQGLYLVRVSLKGSVVATGRFVVE